MTIPSQAKPRKAKSLTLKKPRMARVIRRLRTPPSPTSVTASTSARKTRRENSSFRIPLKRNSRTKRGSTLRLSRPPVSKPSFRTVASIGSLTRSSPNFAKRLPVACQTQSPCPSRAQTMRPRSKTGFIECGETQPS